MPHDKLCRGLLMSNLLKAAQVFNDPSSYTSDVNNMNQNVETATALDVSAKPARQNMKKVDELTDSI